MVGFPALSGSFFELGNEFKKLALGKVRKTSHFTTSKYTYPSVIMYVTSLEAFFNEQLALSTTKIEDENVKRSVLKLQEDPLNKEKIKTIFKRYTGSRLDTNKSFYQDVIALIDVRHEIIHYTPRMIEGNKWPLRLRPAVVRSKMTIASNADWSFHLAQVGFAEWAHDTVKSVIQEFCGMTGAMDPFNNPVEPARWE